MDSFFSSVWNKIKAEQKFAFFSAFTVGILTHAFAMTNDLLTTDSMWNIISRQDMISSGRQFLTFLCGISSDYFLPWMNGILTVLYLSLAAVIFTEGFGIKTRTGAVLTGALTVAFPVIAATFSFSYTIDGYALAILLSAAAFLICDRFKYGFIPAAFVLALAIGAYQSYFSVTILLCVFALILMILKGEELKDVIGKAWRYAVMGGLGYLVYVISLKVMMSAKGVSMSGYQGTDKVLSFSFANIGSGLSESYHAFFRYFRMYGYYYRFGFMRIFFAIFMIACVLSYLFLFIKHQRYKQVWRVIVSLVLLAVVPVGACLVCVMAPDVYFHIIMRYPMIVPLIFGIAVLSEADSYRADMISGSTGVKTKDITAFGVWTVIGTVSVIVLIFEYAVIDNIVYFNLNEKYEKSYAMCEEVVWRIHETEGYTSDMPVAILGGDPNRTYYPWSDHTGDVLGYMQGASGDYVLNSTDGYAEFCRHYIGTAIVPASPATQQELVEDAEFKEMPCFPEKGGVRIIGGVLVIKMGG